MNRTKIVSAALLLCFLCAFGALAQQGLFRPAILALPQVTAHSAALSWTASATSGVTYRVYRGGTSGGPYQQIAQVAALAYVDGSVAEGATYFWVVAAVDSAGTESVYSNQVSGTIPGPLPGPLVITTASLPPGRVGSAYSAALAATGGSGTRAWSMAPSVPGLTLSASGALAGTPTAASIYQSVFTVSDGSSSASKTLTLTIEDVPPPPVGVTSFGMAGIGPGSGDGDSNSILMLRARSGSIGGVTQSCSVYVKAPVSLSPNNRFQCALYSDSGGVPGALLAASPSATVSGNAWNMVELLGVRIAADTWYWIAYNSNGLDDASNNLALTQNVGTIRWGSQTFGTWPQSPTVPGTASNSSSLFVTYALGEPAITISIVPVSATVPAQGTQQFAATVTNTTNTAVSWSASCGAVSTLGLYTAPGSAGVCSVTAASQVDPTKIATATVSVSALPPPPAPLAITTTALPNAVVGVAYSATVTASGGVLPYSFSGSGLPSGLFVSASGLVNGTPSTAGTSAAVISVTDDAGVIASAAISMTVAPAAIPLPTLTFTCSVSTSYITCTATVRNAVSYRVAYNGRETFWAGFAAPLLDRFTFRFRRAELPAGANTFRAVAVNSDGREITVSRTATN